MHKGMRVDLTINTRRFIEDFEELSSIGRTNDGGVNRPALSHAHLEARSWFRKKAEEAGLELRIDGAGNHSAFLPCGTKNTPTLLLGSHLDSVPNGGRFDGALGVLAALETLRVINECGIPLPVNLEAIDFTDEEGTLVSFLGSFAFTGKLKPETLYNPRGGKEKLENGLKLAGLTPEGVLSARRDSKTLAGYLELHIEQGRHLVNAKADIGVVSSISGICFYNLTYIGKADHAGTISMQERLDAAQGASAFTLAARKLLLEKFTDCLVNIGQMEFEPGGFNIVPERAKLSLEFRAPKRPQLEQLESALLENAQAQAHRFGLGLEVEHLGRRFPSPMSPVAQTAIAEASKSMNFKHVSLVSGAGHDAQSLADLCPTGMIFVPSKEGASHSSKEFTKPEDCVNGANVLLQTTLRMAHL